MCLRTQPVADVVGWLMGYRLVAQAILLVFVGIVVMYAWVANQRDGGTPTGPAYRVYRWHLHRRFSCYSLGLLLFMLSGLGGGKVYYMLINAAWLRSGLGMRGNGLWRGIRPVSAGVFGIGTGVMV